MDRVVGAIANIGSIARRHCTLILAFRFLEQEQLSVFGTLSKRAVLEAVPLLNLR